MNTSKIGFIGLGKLGLPCAAALSTKLSTEIYCTDKNPEVKKYIETKTVPYSEEQIEDYLNQSNLIFTDSISDVVAHSDVVFVAVQTPHSPEYERIPPLPDTKKDFDYSYLESALSEIRDAAIHLEKKTLDVVVISTVLPGTTRKRLLPIVNGTSINILYNPYFIAMGTTIYDFLNPEFTIIGYENEAAAARLRSIYSNFLSAPKLSLTYEEAELVKVSYNTFIGMKIVFANLLAEITHSLGGNVEKVTGALSLANNRLISSKYLSAGMGDGGGCHPRDQIAMSWLAEDLGLSYDLFSSIASARDLQTERHAKILKDYVQSTGKPLVIMGEAYKKDINLTVGSPSKLLQYYLKKLEVPFTVFDPIVYPEQTGDFSGPHTFYVATPHSVFRNYFFPLDSVVVDPWPWGTTVEMQYSIKYIWLGRGRWG